MAINNKTIETAVTHEVYALVVKRDGVQKFLGKNWGTGQHADCTVKLDNARRFYSREAALQCFEEEDVAKRGAELIGVATIQIHKTLLSIK